MTPIRYVIGDATHPQGDKPLKLIVHVANDIGGWGRGFVLAVSKRWRQPEEYYRAWARGDYRVAQPIMPPDWSNTFINLPPPQHKPFALGQCQFVPVEWNIMVVNMIGQHDIKWVDNVPPIRYDAIRSCLKEIADYAGHHHADVHGPRFGSALAGGSWDQIERILQEEVCARDIDVTIYDLPK